MPHRIPVPTSVVAERAWWVAHEVYLPKLSARMQLALEARYGLQSGDILTLDEVAQKFNVTRERIRQIVGQARAEVKRLEAASGLDPLSESSDIYCLNLGSRAFVILYNMGLKTVRDLLKQSADSLLELKGFGPGALQNVEQTLAEHGWSLK